MTAERAGAFVRQFAEKLHACTRDYSRQVAASPVLARASSCRPSSARRPDPGGLARPGRNTPGRASASCRPLAPELILTP